MNPKPKRTIFPRLSKRLDEIKDMHHVGKLNEEREKFVLSNNQTRIIEFCGVYMLLKDVDRIKRSGKKIVLSLNNKTRLIHSTPSKERAKELYTNFLESYYVAKYRV
jgi:hypothetical protein